MKTLRHFRTYLEVNVTRQNEGKNPSVHLTGSYQKLNLNLMHKNTNIYRC